MRVGRFFMARGEIGGGGQLRPVGVSGRTRYVLDTSSLDNVLGVNHVAWRDSGHIDIT